MGRFENLDNDISKVFHSLGINEVTLPKHNQSHHTHYSSWYTPKTRDLIVDRFAKDIETFNYKFETTDKIR